MKKQQFSAIKIAEVLKKFETGSSLEELTRSYGISKGTLYNWPNVTGGWMPPR
ncbi:transposase [Proteiniphilum sp. UBA5384]|uniref:transposase n=1 Tax=Proteiniphilum sp. UBA5384 TaxID=1947279 RepID=UPI0039C97B7D